MKNQFVGDYTIDSKNDQAVGIRLPMALYKDIKFLAGDNYRTFNAMIVLLLSHALQKPKIETLMDRVYKKQLEQDKRLEAIEARLKQVYRSGSGVESPEPTSQSKDHQR